MGQIGKRTREYILEDPDEVPASPEPEREAPAAVPEPVPAGR